MKTMALKISGVDMRDAFFDEVYAIAKNDSRVMLLSADMGAHSLVRFKKELPRQYLNVGIAEQNMVSIAAGLSLGGKKVFIYTIIPFVTMRCYEQIKIDLCCMNLPVVIVGVGPGFTYGSDGPTHHATSDIAIMRVLPGMAIFNPSDPVVAKSCAAIAHTSASPTYIRVDKGVLPLIYDESKENFLEGLSVLKQGRDLTIVSTGIMVHRALKIAEELDNKHALSAGVVDLYRIKPLNTQKLLTIFADSKHIVTLEENNVTSGIGSALSELLCDHKKNISLRRIAVPDEHCFKSGSRDDLHALYGLDVEGIIKNILQ